MVNCNCLLSPVFANVLRENKKTTLKHDILYLNRYNTI